MEGVAHWMATTNLVLRFSRSDLVPDHNENMTVLRQLMFSGWQNAAERFPFDRIEAARAIAALPPEELVLDRDGQITAVEVDQVGTATTPTYFQLLALRDFDSRPLDWGPGTGASPIQMLQDRYPADITHVALWEDNIAAYDRHANAPGLGRLALYMRVKADQRAQFVSLYDPTVIDQLDDLETIRGFEYGIYDHNRFTHTADTGLLETFFPRAPAPSISVRLGMSRKSPRDAQLDPEVTEAMLQAATKAEDLLDSLYVSGRSKTRKTPAGNPKTVTLNLLSHRLQVSRDVRRAPEGGNLAARPEVYQALRDAKRELQDAGTLQRAATAAALFDVE